MSSCAREGLAGGEAAELGVDAVAFLLKRALSDFSSVSVWSRSASCRSVRARCDHFARRQLVGGRDGIERDLSKQIVEGIEPLLGALSLRAGPRDIAGDAFEIVAAVSGHRDHRSRLATSSSSVDAVSPASSVASLAGCSSSRSISECSSSALHGTAGFDDAEAHEVGGEHIMTIEACDDGPQSSSWCFARSAASGVPW